MNKLIPVELLEKYLSGNCSAEETILVKEWYESFEQEPNHIDTLNTAAQKQLEVKIYNRIIDGISVVEEDETPVKVIDNRNAGFWYKIAGAAAVLLIATTAGLLYNNHTPKTEPIAGSDVQQIIAVTNNSNHICKSILPDNSVVWLSPHATLKYPKVFDSKSRMVSLSGEGFFEVTKNPDRPFIITSHTIITKVWGTSFLVRDNKASRSADVSVVTGKVSVSIKKKSNKNLLSINKDEVMLYPQQKATYMADAQVLKPGSTKNNPELKIWKHANLFFDNKSLKDIVPILNATYNAHIKVANEKLNHYLLNADFSGLNLPDVLEALSKALNIDYSFINNTIELNQPIN
ncbi:MAG: FecR family protein [Mucilaginibacter sp.]|nr:FecR family protein [Mucilaginibacter sp.]